MDDEDGVEERQNADRRAVVLEHLEPVALGKRASLEPIYLSTSRPSLQDRSEPLRLERFVETQEDLSPNSRRQACVSPAEFREVRLGLR